MAVFCSNLVIEAIDFHESQIPICDLKFEQRTLFDLTRFLSHRLKLTFSQIWPYFLTFLSKIRHFLFKIGHVRLLVMYLGRNFNILGLNSHCEKARSERVMGQKLVQSNRVISGIISISYFLRQFLLALITNPFYCLF